MPNLGDKFAGAKGESTRSIVNFDEQDDGPWLPDGRGLDELGELVAVDDRPVHLRLSAPGRYPRTACDGGLGEWWTGIASEATCQACLEVVPASWLTGHTPAPPQTIGVSTGLVYCKACGFLLFSNSKGRTRRADRPCTPVRVGVRSTPDSAGDGGTPGPYCRTCGGDQNICGHTQPYAEGDVDA